MPDSQVIPIFPLSIVVFPEQTLPLHIFEDRYKEMIADCRVAEQHGGELPIGISFGQDTSVHREVGCSVVLAKVLNEYDDGRLDIITVGRQRYRIGQTYSDRSYLTAEVQFFVDIGIDESTDATR